MISDFKQHGTYRPGFCPQNGASKLVLCTQYSEKISVEMRNFVLGDRQLK